MAKVFIINDTSVTAGADTTSDLGTSSIKWKDIYSGGKLTVGTVSASGAIIGGSASFTGTLTVGTLSATGNVISGARVSAASGSFSGLLTAGTASITGAVIGASASFSGTVTVGTLSASGAIIAASGSISGGFIIVGSSTFGEFLITDGKNISLGTVSGTVIATATNQLLAFYGASPVVQQTGLTTQVGTVTFSEPTTPDYAIADLTSVDSYGFVSLDEGQSILKVIANLQTRVQELETKLKSYGFLP